MGFLKNNKINVTHDESKTRLYIIWNDMRGRCLNEKAIRYKDYGGRGITICPKWTNDYISFRDWALNNGYQEGLQINRINNDDNYEPSNCNWVTLKENTRHRRGQKIKNIEIANEIRDLYKTGEYTQKEIGKIYNITGQTVSKIIHNIRWNNI